MTDRTVFDTPLWVFENEEDDGSKILPLVCELPNKVIFTLLESSNQFEILSSLMIRLINDLQGFNTGCTTFVKSSKPALNNDYDVIFLMFKKDYTHTTKTIVLPMNEKSLDVTKYTSNVTRNFFKQGTIIKKFNTQLVVTGDKLTFTYSGVGDIPDGITTTITNQIA